MSALDQQADSLRSAIEEAVQFTKECARQVGERRDAVMGNPVRLARAVERLKTAVANADKFGRGHHYERVSPDVSTKFEQTFLLGSACLAAIQKGARHGTTG